VLDVVAFTPMSLVETVPVNVEFEIEFVPELSETAVGVFVMVLVFSVRPVAATPIEPLIEPVPSMLKFVRPTLPLPVTRP
jgi:hypothetical protein